MADELDKSVASMSGVLNLITEPWLCKRNALVLRKPTEILWHEGASRSNLLSNGSEGKYVYIERVIKQMWQVFSKVWGTGRLHDLPSILGLISEGAKIPRQEV